MGKYHKFKRPSSHVLSQNSGTPSFTRPLVGADGQMVDIGMDSRELVLSDEAQEVMSDPLTYGLW